MKNDGGAAFPQYFNGALPGIGVEKFNGLSMRDYFAAAALQRIHLVYEIEVADLELPDHMKRSKAFAKYAYEIADAMLAERERE